jgi:hypothetical protein
MFINFINPRYPGHETAAGTCHFRMLKHKPEICQVIVLSPCYGGKKCQMQQGDGFFLDSS